MATAMIGVSVPRFVLAPVGVALLLILAFWGVPTWWYFHTHESTDDAQVDGHIVPVIAKLAQSVRNMDLRMLKRDENLVDLETDKVVLEVPAPADGVLKEIKFAEGATVTSGSRFERFLARLDQIEVR